MIVTDRLRIVPVNLESTRAAPRDALARADFPPTLPEP
jgi:hypothetical protein